MAEQEEAILMAVRKHLSDAETSINQREFDQARRSAELAVQVARQQEHVSSLAAAYYGIAAVVWRSGGDHQEAHHYASLAAEHTHANTQTDLLVRTLIARLKLARGNLEHAQYLSEDLLDYYTQTADLPGRADALRNLGDIHAAKQEPAHAETRYRESLSIYQTLNDPLNHCGLLLSLGTLLYQNHRHTEAAGCWQQARNLAEAHGFRDVVHAADEGLELLH
ncbi:MAG: tetratricopeptide repeat protein [Anaerolineae bacterium]|nr:tetratricopeptide repeat protein [Anaerolineae bacterium]